MNQQTNITGILERFEEEFQDGCGANNCDSFFKEEVKTFLQKELTTLIDSIPSEEVAIWEPEGELSVMENMNKIAVNSMFEGYNNHVQEIQSFKDKAKL